MELSCESYAAFLNAIGCDEWPSLKSKLDGPHAESYTVYIQSYMGAREMVDQAQNEYSAYVDNLTDYPTWDEIEEQERLDKAWARLQRYERRIFTELKAMVKE